MPNNTYEPADEIQSYARDEMPETFDALADSRLFGPAALERRARGVMWKIWGAVLTPEEQEALLEPVKQYAGKLLARTLIGPGIDYWSKQVVSQAAGTREQVSYAANRSADLQELDKRLVAEIADLLPEIEVVVPPASKVAGAAPHVQQAGALDTPGATPLYTPDPYDTPPVYGPPDTTTGGTATP